jgi:indole-3-glycerol phosphate synthase
MVQRKKIEVNTMLRQHQGLDDPLFMRMAYMADKCDYLITKALKRKATSENFHTLSVLVDMKRRSPTISSQKIILDYPSASEFAEVLTRANVDAFLINTDEIEYGGKATDLRDCTKALRALRPENPPACILKDIIIHPIQV